MKTTETEFEKYLKTHKSPLRIKMETHLSSLKQREIIDESYQLYMPQVRYEIEELTKFLWEYFEANKIFQPNILEIGTKFGGTFNIWNRLVQELSKLSPATYGDPDPKLGMCISIDVSDGGIHGGISEEEMDKRDLWFHERFENCHFIRGNSHDFETERKFSRLIQTQEIKPNLDFLFIDGDHTFHGVEQDWEMYSVHLKKGSICCFHDIIISDQHHERNVYVGEFWRELTKDRMLYKSNACEIDGNEYEVFEFVEDEKNQSWAGIGALRKL